MSEVVRLKSDERPPSVEPFVGRPFGKYALTMAVAERAGELIAAWRGVPFRESRNPVEMVIRQLVSGRLRFYEASEEERAPVLATSSEPEEREEALKAA